MKNLAIFLVLGGLVAATGCGGGSGSGGGSTAAASIASQTTTQTTPGSTTGSTRPAIPMDVKLAASKTALAIGDTVEVRVDATAVKDLYGAGLDLSYDPTLLEFQSASSGTLIANATVASGLRGGKAGVVTVGTSAEGAAPGGSGSGSVLVLRFRARGKGAARIAPVDVILEDAAGTPGTAAGIGAITVSIQ